MKPQKTLVILLTSATLTALSTAALADPVPPPAQGCEEAITVFQDVSLVGRRNHAASNITRRHQEMAARGWRFADLEIYTENGDLEGFFLTYTRPAPCNQAPPTGQASDDR